VRAVRNVAILATLSISPLAIVQAADLNDTGLTQCYNAAAAPVAQASTRGKTRVTDEMPQRARDSSAKLAQAAQGLTTQKLPTTAARLRQAER